MKIVANRCYGGFLVSEKLLKLLNIKVDEDKWPLVTNEDFGIKSDNVYAFRAHPDFVKAVETLGEEANGCFANLKVIEIPDDVNWTIEENDGYEKIVEVHRKW